MTRFTDSPYERMMTRRPEGGKETSRPPSLPHKPPLLWLRELWKSLRRRLPPGNGTMAQRKETKKMSVLIIFIKLIVVFDLLVIAVYFGGDILSTMLNKLRRKAKTGRFL